MNQNKVYLANAINYLLVVLKQQKFGTKEVLGVGQISTVKRQDS